MGSYFMPGIHKGPPGLTPEGGFPLSIFHQPSKGRQGRRLIDFQPLQRQKGPFASFWAFHKNDCKLAGQRDMLRCQLQQLSCSKEEGKPYPEGPGIEFFQSRARFNPDWNGFVIEKKFNNIIEKSSILVSIRLKKNIEKKSIIIEKI